MCSAGKEYISDSFGDERVSSLPMVVLRYRYKWDHTNITYDLGPLSKCFRSEMQDSSKDYCYETREWQEEMDVVRKTESLSGAYAKTLCTMPKINEDQQSRS